MRVKALEPCSSAPGGFWLLARSGGGGPRIPRWAECCRKGYSSSSFLGFQGVLCPIHLGPRPPSSPEEIVLTTLETFQPPTGFQLEKISSGDVTQILALGHPADAAPWDVSVPPDLFCLRSDKSLRPVVRSQTSLGAPGTTRPWPLLSSWDSQSWRGRGSVGAEKEAGLCGEGTEPLSRAWNPPVPCHHSPMPATVRSLQGDSRRYSGRMETGTGGEEARENPRLCKLERHSALAGSASLGL